MESLWDYRKACEGIELLKVYKVVEKFIMQYDELVGEYESLEMCIKDCENLADTIYYSIIDLYKAIEDADFYKVDVLTKAIKCLFDGFSYHLKNAKLTRVN